MASDTQGEALAWQAPASGSAREPASRVVGLRAVLALADIKDEELNSILDGLCKMFEEKHKRPPTEDEIKIWISQLKDASTD